jgi:hypothetical protein
MSIATHLGPKLLQNGCAEAGAYRRTSPDGESPPRGGGEGSFVVSLRLGVPGGARPDGLTQLLRAVNHGYPIRGGVGGGRPTRQTRPGPLGDRVAQHSRPSHQPRGWRATHPREGRAAAPPLVRREIKVGASRETATLGGAFAMLGTGRDSPQRVARAQCCSDPRTRHLQPGLRTNVEPLAPTARQRSPFGSRGSSERFDRLCFNGASWGCPGTPGKGGGEKGRHGGRRTPSDDQGAVASQRPDLRKRGESIPRSA